MPELVLWMLELAITQHYPLLSITLIQSTCPELSSRGYSTLAVNTGSLGSRVSLALCVTQLARRCTRSTSKACHPILAVLAAVPLPQAAAAIEPAKQGQLELALDSKFGSSSLLACWFQSFRVLWNVQSQLTHKFRSWSLKLENAEVINLKPCCCTCMGSQVLCSGTCQSYDLRLAASLTWSCPSGVTVFFLMLLQDGNAAIPCAGHRLGVRH